mgnify:CR=1 FL=1
MNYPEPNRFYKHYKGGLYKVLFLSRHTETQEVLVNYQSVHFGSYYARPLDNWNALAIDDNNKNVERFKLIKNEDL